jgi:hypothetical protein
MPVELQIEVAGYLQPDVSKAKSMLTASKEDILNSMYVTSTDDSGLPAFLKYNLYGGYTINSQSMLGTITGTVLGRYQDPPSSTKPHSSWDAGRGAATDGLWYHYTFFPVIRSLTAGSTHYKRAVTYVAFYSNFDPWRTPTDITESEKVGARIPMLEPNWVVYQTPSDRFNNNQGERIKVDTNFLDITNNEVNSLLAIAASLNNCHPRPTDGDNVPYLCFFPLVARNVFRTEGQLGGASASPSKLKEGWWLKGSSMGMAVAMVISGMPSIHSTGYLSHIEHNAMLSDRKYGQGDSALKALPSGAYPTEAQFNIVENVDYVPLKVAYCLYWKLPLVIPSRDYLDRPMDPGKIRGQIQLIVGIAPSLLTMAAVNDAAPILNQDSNAYGGLATPIAMGVTLTDFLILSAYLYINCAYKTKWKGAIDSNPLVATTRTQLGNMFQTQLDDAHQRSLRRREENVAIKDRVEKAATAQQAYDEAIALRQQYINAREAPILAKKAANKKKRDEQKAVRDTLLGEARKAGAIKAALKNPNVTDTDRQEFLKQYTQYEQMRAQVRPEKDERASAFFKYIDAVQPGLVKDRIKKTRAKKEIASGTQYARRGAKDQQREDAAQRQQPAQGPARPAGPAQQPGRGGRQLTLQPKGAAPPANAQPVSQAAGQFAGGQFGRGYNQAGGMFGANEAGGMFGANEAMGQFGANEAGFFGDLAKGVARAAPVVGGIAQLFSGM